MSSIAASLVTISAAIWVGAIVFQSAVVAPSVFASLDEPQTRALLRTLFPRLFRLGLACGVVMLAASLLLLAAEGGGNALIWLASAALSMLVLAGLSLWLVPRINGARDAGAVGSARFRRLHRLSVLLTVAILILGIAVLATLGGAATCGAES